jgi:3-keto-5-aminohexanoate cleavage enzyme
VIINMSTGTIGPDIGGAVACLERIRPEMAACNAGSLNYLKVKSDGSWAWPPMLFDNPVDKVERFLKAMAKSDSIPEFECFDVGIVRCVGLYCDAGLATHPEYNFVMGVESGMPADPELLPILIKLMKPACNWQVTAIGRENIWPLQQRVADLGGMLRTGLEDTFYLPNGTKARGNGELIDALVRTARGVGREIASPAEARQLIGVKTQN